MKVETTGDRRVKVSIPLPPGSFLAGAFELLSPLAATQAAYALMDAADRIYKAEDAAETRRAYGSPRYVAVIGEDPTYVAVIGEEGA